MKDNLEEKQVHEYIMILKEQIDQLSIFVLFARIFDTIMYRIHPMIVVAMEIRNESS
jgi:hypothetical protein